MVFPGMHCSVERKRLNEIGSMGVEWEKCSNKLNQERLFQCFHFLVSFFFFLMFPFTYFHLLLLCLPVGHLIFTLQDSEIIKAKPPGGSRTKYIGFFLFYTLCGHAGSLSWLGRKGTVEVSEFPTRRKLPGFWQLSISPLLFPIFQPPLSKALLPCTPDTMIPCALAPDTMS